MQCSRKSALSGHTFCREPSIRIERNCRLLEEIRESLDSFVKHASAASCAWKRNADVKSANSHVALLRFGGAGFRQLTDWNLVTQFTLAERRSYWTVVSIVTDAE